MGKGKTKKNGKGSSRVAVVGALRTPFQKSGTGYGDVSALDLAKLVVVEMLERSGARPSDVGQVVYGQVAPSVQMPNIAREIVLGTG
ncbi:MAG: acetyl-CoA C-acyltransferase, partial [Myxococcales bacterium]|nr:acetyl-CoA C-acyltransferase [Myxococcales bacterium]